MKKIGIWGVGAMAEGLVNAFDLTEVKIEFYIDSNDKKQGTSYNGIKIISPTDLANQEYDYIFISTQKYEREILEQLLSMGVQREKVISASINNIEMSKVYNLFTAKGISYLTYNCLNTYICSEKKRIKNLFIKEKYEREAAQFIIKNFIEDVNAPGRDVIFDDRNEYYNYVMNKVNCKSGLYLEFGVNRGSSINYISNLIGENIIYGFDSFEGLPEKWLPGWKVGAFDQGGNLPSVNKNVRLIKGWFDATLPEFINEHKNEKCALIHIDSDLYSSAKCVLSLLKNNIEKGTIIMFDELVGQINWQKDDEYRALKEFLEETGYHFKYIACSYVRADDYLYRVTIEII